MTNKLVKKEIFLKVLNEFKKKIFYHKWNYHEDNIWSVLLHRTAKLKHDINKFVYIYKMNDQSLIINKHKNSIEFKNRVYLSQAYQDFNQDMYFERLGDVIDYVLIDENKHMSL